MGRLAVHTHFVRRSMNNPSDTFRIDENLARLLAAFDQGMDGDDAKSPTINVPHLPSLPGERPASSLGAANEGSLGEVLPHSAHSRPRHSPLTPAPGSHAHRVGRFELRRQLGKGGCGIVFLAFDPKLEREVALKIPRPEMLLSEDARRRLIREALAAAEFDHPNLVPVYETGEIGPFCFIATAFCPGVTLGEWLERQAFPVPIRQAARLVATLAEAVQHAHDRGVLHRDLKPNNIILQATKDDPNETEPPPGSCQLRSDCYIPRVVDFGLAKLLERGGPSQTTTRQILGTPKYMAPEQAQARHDDVGPAADVYALGVILYESVAGRAPYEGESDVEVLRLAIEGNMTAPRRLRHDLPRDLEAICLKAMHRIPGKRYRTAIDLADDLRRFLDGKPTLARPLQWPGRAARWLRRNDQAVALGMVTAIAAVLLAVGSWYIYQTRQLRSDRDTVLKNQAERTRGDLQREYARDVRAAFLAWRAGDAKTAADYLEAARRVARSGGETTDFAVEYLSRLVSAEKLAIVCPAGAVTALAVSPDGTHLATGHPDGTLAVWASATGEPIATVTARDRAIVTAEFATNGELRTRDVLGRGRSWKLDAAGLTAVGQTDEVPPAATPGTCTARHGTRAYTAGEDGVVRVWEAAEDESLLPAFAVSPAPVAIAVHPTERQYVITTADFQVIPFAGQSAQPAIETGSHRIIDVRFNPDGHLLGIELREKHARVIDLTTELVPLLGGKPPDHANFTAASVSGDGKRLAVGDDRGRISIWSIDERNLLGIIETGKVAAIHQIVLSDDGRVVATPIAEGVRVWTVGENKPLSTLPIEPNALFRFLGADRLVQAGQGNVVRVWSLGAAAEEMTLHGHVGRVAGLGLSPDGRILVTGAATGEVKFWDIRTGQELMSFHRHTKPVRIIEFSLSGKLLITGGTNGGTRGELAIWEAAKE